MNIHLEEIKAGVMEVINKLDQIIASEVYRSTYIELKEKYENILILINNNAPQEIIEKDLADTIRLLMEAPPRSKELGMEAILLMDKLYKHLKSLN